MKNVNKLKETEIELSTLKSAHKQYVNDVGPKVEMVSRLIERKIPFLDEGNLKNLMVENDILNKLYSECGISIS